jgi:hypothetical protein
VVDIALAEVLRRPARTALRTLSIAAAVAVTLLLEGFRLGVDRQMAAPASALPAPLVAIEKGATHFVGLPSRLPQAARAAIEGSPGVAAAHPLVSVPVIFETRGRRTPLELVAYDSAGAPVLDAGRSISGAHQIVLDRKLAKAHGLHLGDTIRLFSRDFEVVGLARNSDVFFSPLAYVTYDELIDTYLAADVPGAMGGAPLLSFSLSSSSRAPVSRRRVGPCARESRPPTSGFHAAASACGLPVVEAGGQLDGTSAADQCGPRRPSPGTPTDGGLAAS